MWRTAIISLRKLPNNDRQLLRNVSARHKPTSTIAVASPSVIVAPHEDGMTRYPSLTSSRGILRSFDYFGTLVFASSGAITAASCNLDLLGAVALGTMTAVGGGTIRDVIIIGRAPFWSGKDGEEEYLWLSLFAAGLTFFLYPKDDFRKVFDHEAMEWSDSLGLGAFAVIGVQNGIRAGLSAPLCILCGVSTGTFGGATRDVLAQRPGGVRIFNSYADIYATVAMASGASYLAARKLGLPLGGRIFAGVGVAMAMRFLAREYDWRLPTWKNSGFNWNFEKKKKEA